MGQGLPVSSPPAVTSLAGLVSDVGRKVPDWLSIGFCRISGWLVMVEGL